MSNRKQQRQSPGDKPVVAAVAAKTKKTPPATEVVAESVKAHHLVRRMVYSAISLLGLTLLVWVIGNLYMAKYNIGGTTAYAHLPDARLQTMVAQAAQKYRLSLADTAGKPAQQFNLQAMGIRPDAKATVVAMRHEQGTLKGRLVWWHATPMSLVATIDQAAFTTFITQHVTSVTQPAKDATLAISGGNVQIINGSTGKAYGLASPQQTILNAVQQLRTAPLQRHIVTAEPAITAATLRHVKDSVEKIIQQHVTIAADGQTVTPNASDIANWLDLKPDQTAKTVAVTINKDHVLDFMNQVASDHSHPARAQVRTAVGTIAGSTGTTFTNQQAVVDGLADALLKGNGAHAELAAQHTPFKTVAATGSTSKWIEVDLSSKRMYALVGTTVQRTFLVSAGKPGTPTVTGQFAIYSKYSKQTMTGANADGSNYVQPDVPWVNYFYRDYAIHGNYWRPASYFGNVNSSHGCVGVRDNDALWIYSWAPVGTPVFIHN